MNSAKSASEIVNEAVCLSAEVLAAGSRVTTLRAARLKTRPGSKKSAKLAEALMEAKMEQAALSHRRDAAWALANSRR